MKYLCKNTTSTSTSSRSSWRKSFKKWDTDSYVICPQTTMCLEEKEMTINFCHFGIWKQSYIISHTQLMLLETSKYAHSSSFIQVKLGNRSHSTFLAYYEELKTRGTKLEMKLGYSFGLWISQVILHCYPSAVARERRYWSRNAIFWSQKKPYF